MTTPKNQYFWFPERFREVCERMRTNIEATKEKFLQYKPRKVKKYRKEVKAQDFTWNVKDRKECLTNILSGLDIYAKQSTW